MNKKLTISRKPAKHEPDVWLARLVVITIALIVMGIIVASVQPNIPQPEQHWRFMETIVTRSIEILLFLVIGRRLK